MPKWVAHLQEARALHQRGDLARARTLFDKVLKATPTNVDALTGLAVIAAQSKDLDRALDYFDRALRLDPRNPATHCNRGLALHNQGDVSAALRSFDQALALRPEYAIALFNRGNALRELARADAALDSYDRAIAADPRHVAAHYQRGLVLLGLGRWLDALASFDAAIALDPRHANAYANRGVVLNLLQRPTAALDSFERSLALDPGSADVYASCGEVLASLKRYAESLAHYDRAIARGSRRAGVQGSRRHVKMQICDWRDHDAERQDLADRIERGEPAAPPFHVLTAFDDADLQKKSAVAWMRSQCSVATAATLPPPPRGERIRIAYFSADFHDHATLYLMAQLFEEHDRSSFDITAFSYGPDTQSPMRTRLRAACDRFHEVRQVSDEAIVKLAREQPLDIAVDLKGLTQHGRPTIFARRVAPVQISYLGYPGTLGAPFMDYLVADRTLIGVEDEKYYTEKIIYLPDSYQVNDAHRVVADRHFTRTELGLPSTGFVFCCFNNSFKITPATFDVWMRILSQVDGSVLWLYRDNPIAADNLRGEARQRGIDPARLVFADAMPLSDHLARHRAADLFLDTLPYNAHTTASDALWAGLPLLTCAGASFAGRVAASLLTAVGLPELITTSRAQYEMLAIELAKDPERLAALAATLRDNRGTSSLFDARRLTRMLEAAYRAAHGRHLAGLGTATIVVRPDGATVPEMPRNSESVPPSAN